MLVDFKGIENIDERDKAIGIPIKHKGITKVLWCPKSLIDNKNGWKKNKFIDMPDWFYDKKITELFL